LRCVASGDPAPIVSWKKIDDDMGAGVRTTGNVLRIASALVTDRGIYACTATNAGGEAQAFGMIEIESKSKNLRFRQEFFSKPNFSLKDVRRHLLSCTPSPTRL